MKAVTEILTELVGGAFADCGCAAELGAVSVSDRADLCQFQCNGAFAAAKQLRKPPFAIAEEVAERLRGEDVFSAVEAVRPGFINLTLSDGYLVSLMREISADPNLGIPQVEKKETIIIDYGGPNVAKPLHIGHLRSAVIGEAVKRIARAAGCTVYGDIHLGDWGLQIGLVIAELNERHPDWRCFAEDFSEGEAVPELDVDTLNEVYPFASQKSKEDPDFKAAAKTATNELQNGRAGYVALWREILRVSTADLKRSYDRLGVHFDLWYGESDADRYEPKLMEILTEKGLLLESDGAKIVEIAEDGDKAPMPPVIIKKSDNSSIYATTDLSTIIQRQEDFHPDKIWYVVDKRQSLHFTQVFRCARKAGLVDEDCSLEFLGFGTMNGSDGHAYKTREGGVMRLSELLDTAAEAAAEKLTGSEFTESDRRSETAERVGIAAIKFGDLINHRSKDYIFDLDKFLSFEGKTGTYLLYTVTRINSILKKAGADGDFPIHGDKIHTDAERGLMLTILLSGEAFKHALAERAPNYVCENAYALASAFSVFYHDNRILGEPDADKRAAWLGLCALTKRLLLKQLEVLAIEPVESM